MDENQLELEKKVKNLETRIQDVLDENKRAFDKIQLQRHLTAVGLILIAGVLLVFESANKPSAVVASLILSGIIHLIGLAL